MKLQEIFDQLTHGELSQLSIGGGAAGEITPANYERVLAHVNLGLTALHKRFLLKEGRLVLELMDGVTLYPLNSKYAVNGRGSRMPIRYILDTPEAPFQDDLFKIERVFAESGIEFPLNVSDDPYSMRTPKLDLLEVPVIIVEPSTELPAELRTETLEIYYRANHPIIRTEDGEIDPEETEVDLPYSHLEPLLYYVASRVHTPTGMTNEMNMGNAYFAKYEAACQELERLNLTPDPVAQGDRLERNGWV